MEKEEDNIFDTRTLKTAFWRKKWQIPNTPWNISGYSMSAYRTGFYINELDLLLDAGPQHFKRPLTIMITHTHGDHIALLPFTLIGNPGQASVDIVNIYGPSKAEPYIRQYINTLFSTNSMTPMASLSETDKWYRYNPVNQGDTFQCTLKGTDLKVEVFKCDHTKGIPTVSYGISVLKQKLKEQYQGLPGREIAQLRKSGVVVTEEKCQKKLAYVCDTTIKAFEWNPTILDYAVIFIECTFLLDDELDLSKEKKHIHWRDLKPIVVGNPHIQFVLFHFSQRYEPSDIANFFENVCKQDSIGNIKWW